ncbi:NAD(P)/FAD-dependent oxidoreductase [Saccharopolyspora erythraea]|uniref:NAD(P)/FAD-dependent oxidoreductase n=1 Tax=Saccharopolyspora erythraea TaxID=1836 RepID=UPI00030CE4BB|nr:tryptophan 7-halogenase [Saccharopolyspora erythraea]
MNTQRHSNDKTPYDVAILGTGIGGSMLGAILARHGAKVLLIDAGQHPRFAIGESTIPYTLLTLRILADRYDVPEIKALATFTDTSRTIGNTFGVKKHFGFLLHHENEPQDPREVSQFNTPGLLHEAAHLHRQDTDAYLFHVAIRYGCTARQNCRVAEVEFDDSGVTLETVNGEQFRTRYVVDASGFRSPLAEKFGLREDPCRSSTIHGPCGTTCSTSLQRTRCSTARASTGRRCPGMKALSTTCSNGAGSGSLPSTTTNCRATPCAAWA